MFPFKLPDYVYVTKNIKILLSSYVITTLSCWLDNDSVTIEKNEVLKNDRKDRATVKK